MISPDFSGKGGRGGLCETRFPENITGVKSAPSFSLCPAFASLSLSVSKSLNLIALYAFCSRSLCEASVLGNLPFSAVAMWVVKC